MSALNRKLIREVWEYRGQMLSIAAVVATGVMTVLTMRGTYESLEQARDVYYRSARFPDAWVELERAPESALRRLRELPGVIDVESRVTFAATLDVPGVPAPALGRFVSISEHRRAMIGDLFLRRGRYIEPGRRDEVVISDNFADGTSLGPGDTIRAVINGRMRELSIVGTAISPEHSYAVPPGSLFPDDARYGIIWMSREALGPAYDMEGAFNEAVFLLSPRANADDVLAGIDRVLAPYGSLGAYDRGEQISHEILANELKQNRTMGTAIPAMFLAVAAFLLNIVLGRLIATQRTEIGILKAFGYTAFEIGVHYLLFALAAVMAGIAAGSVLGIWLGSGMIDLYGEYFDFPALAYHASGRLVAIAAAVSVAAAGAGALGAVRRATRLQPADAMRPESPAMFRAGILERLGLFHSLPAAARMIVRNIERQPFRIAFSAIGVAFLVAILVIGIFMFDGMDYMMDLQFRVAQREDLSLTFNRPLTSSVVRELAHLDGVTQVEPFRTVPVRLRAGHRARTVALTGLPSEPRLRRIVTAEGGIQALPPHGLVINRVLASQLDVRPGRSVTVEILEGERRFGAVPVSAVVEDFLGISAYMDIDALHDLTRGGRAVSGAALAVADDRIADLSATLKAVPAVAGVASPTRTLETFRQQMADSLFIGVFFILGFSCVIAVAVIYNGARIALSERGRELASLRVLGFSRAEVTVLLLGEQGLITALAIPIGCVLGYALSAAVVANLATDTYRFPLIINARTYVWASFITIVAAALSGWIVRQRLNRMDLVSVLKTRE